MEQIEKLKIIPLKEILDAQENMLETISNTPLVKLNLEIPNKEIYLKLENLQPVGSFKVRGAYNALTQLSKHQNLSRGVFTSSAGNFALGLQSAAKRLNIPCQILCPDNTPEVKINSIIAMDGDVSRLTYDKWWEVMISGKHSESKGVFIHPCCHKDVMAGNGVIGLEILRDLPDVSSIVCSYGEGGHALGIASAVKQLKPDIDVFACEVSTAPPLSESLRVGYPTVVQNFGKSFVDGMNGKAMFPCMWNLVKNLLKDTVVLSLEQICNALRMMIIKNHIVAEGAGAAPVAAALTDKIPNGKIVCVISGGNIDLEVLQTILNGKVP